MLAVNYNACSYLCSNPVHSKMMKNRKMELHFVGWGGDTSETNPPTDKHELNAGFWSLDAFMTYILSLQQNIFTNNWMYEYNKFDVSS